MNRPIAIVAAVAALALSLTTATARTAQAHGASTIDLPPGWAGEGVATGRHGTFYAGSVANGQIAIGSLRSGTTHVFVDTPLVPSATGLKADLRHGLLWVSGAATGKAAVYDLSTGRGIVALTLTTSPSFINDVVVTRDAAYFTDSRSPVLYRVPVSKRGQVGLPQTIHLSGPAAEIVAGAFNLNGIDATADGRTLVAVNSATGALYTINPRTGASAQIDLGGGAVPTGDGILLLGRKLLVLQNGVGTGVNQIAVVQLHHRLTEGRIVDTIKSPLFETATTLARSGNALIAVNAQFVTPPPIDAQAEVVLLRR